MPNVKVTRINNRWHCRLLEGEQVISEMACENQLDIGWACREMMRWFQKLGGDSVHSQNARERHNEDKDPIGKVVKIK